MRKQISPLICLLPVLALAACNSDPEAGVQLGRDQTTGTPSSIPNNPNGSGTPSATGKAPAIGPGCSSSDSSSYCLALKYVVYTGSSGTPVISTDQAVSNLAQINSVWSACKIGFQIDEFVAATPTSDGLNFNTSSSTELTSIRQNFRSDSELLVVTTGAWSGSLGSGSANAWTTLPGGGSYGVVLEEPVGDFPNIIAHELGHYLNLDHASGSTNLMSAIIYQNSTQLTQAQCDAARSAVQYYWKAMLR